MTIAGVKKFLFLLFVIFEGNHALEWSNIHQIDGDFYKNAYEIEEVKSTHEFNLFMDGISDYFYFNNNGLYTHQYKQSVEKIVIGHSSTLSSIPTKVFEKFANLAEFSAVDVSLEEINRDDFESAKNLYYLVLSSNQIKRLENMVFMHCKKLFELDLSSNEINFIHDHAFEGISASIKKIDLSNNKITFLKEDSLILLLKGVTISPEDITLNFTGNQIEEVLPSNQTTDKNFPPLYLALINNKLKAFECTAIEFSFLDLENNEIESLNTNTSFAQLDVSNNKLSQLSIAKSVNYVKALNNQLENITIEDDSQLDTLILSGNQLGNDFLLQVKRLKKLKILKLSDTNLKKLNVDTFADLELLETLQLDQNKISSIGHGVFAHQANLVNLNISDNELESVDLHVFGALSSLENIDLSGNDISRLEDYENIHQIMPKLSTIALERNLWNCKDLAKMRNSFKTQNISITSPQNRVKNGTNFDGFACFEDSDSISQMNETYYTSMFNSTITQQQHELYSAWVFQEKKHFLEMKPILAEQERKEREDTNFLLDLMSHPELMKKLIAASEGLTENSTSNSTSSFTRLEILLIILLLFLIALTAIFAVHKTRRYVNKKIDQIARLRFSRRNSISTVVTYDNSNNV